MCLSFLDMSKAFSLSFLSSEMSLGFIWVKIFRSLSHLILGQVPGKPWALLGLERFPRTALCVSSLTSFAWLRAFLSNGRRLWNPSFVSLHCLLGLSSPDAIEPAHDIGWLQHPKGVFSVPEAGKSSAVGLAQSLSGEGSFPACTQLSSAQQRRNLVSPSSSPCWIGLYRISWTFVDSTELWPPNVVSDM